MTQTSSDAVRGDSLGTILTSPHVPRLLSASLLGRLPTGMAALAILLTVRAHGGSYSLAGALSACYAVAAAAGGPLQGRLIDRTKQPPMLLGAALLSGAAFVGLASIDPAALPVLGAAFAVVAGAATPQLEPCLRVLWSRLLPRQDTVTKAYSLDAAAQELIFVTGPLVVLAASALLGAASGLVVAAALGLLGSVVFARATPSRQWRGSGAATHWAGPLRSVSLLRLLVALMFVGATIGAFTVGITAFAENLATASAAGWLIAANGAGALLGGLLYTRAGAPRDQHTRLRLLLAALMLGYLPLLAEPGMLGMVPLAILSGIALPPVLACSFALVGELAPEGTITEAHAWMITAFGAGNAAGSAVAGVLADAAGVVLALACGVVAAGAALLTTTIGGSRARRRTKP